MKDYFSQPVDFVVDAIDTMSSKLSLIKYCLAHKIPFISSMGMANRMDPTKIEITELSKTSYDPVAKIIRQLVRKRKNKKVKFQLYGRVNSQVYKQELLMKTELLENRKMPTGKFSFCTIGSRTCDCIICSKKKLIETKIDFGKKEKKVCLG